MQHKSQRAAKLRRKWLLQVLLLYQFGRNIKPTALGHPNSNTVAPMLLNFALHLALLLELMQITNVESNHKVTTKHRVVPMLYYSHFLPVTTIQSGRNK